MLVDIENEKKGGLVRNQPLTAQDEKLVREMWKEKNKLLKLEEEWENEKKKKEPKSKAWQQMRILRERLGLPPDPEKTKKTIRGKKMTAGFLRGLMSVLQNLHKPFLWLHKILP